MHKSPTSFLKKKKKKKKVSPTFLEHSFLQLPASLEQNQSQQQHFYHYNATSGNEYYISILEIYSSLEVYNYYIIEY